MNIGVVGNLSNGVILPNPVIEQEIEMPDGSKEMVRMNAPFTFQEMANAYHEQHEEVEGDE